MNPPYFTGTAAQKPAQPMTLPATDRERQTDPAGYLSDQGLVDAVNVALMLGQPLLLTGEPGTGKTQLAFRIAWELGFPDPLVFETKSTTVAKDLFYTYDSLGRFHAAHTPQASQDNRDYISFNALGLAILYANEPESVRALLPNGFKHPGKRRSVVLIDEVDKAPRDFPNDVLNEVEHVYFRIPELQNAKVAADPALRPILIITSNSEKNLPDPFLRRCIYYNIPFPKAAQLARIITSRLSAFRDPASPLLTDAIRFFEGLRQRNLRKQPSTAELINWLNVLARTGAASDKKLRDSEPQLRASLSTLVKALEDLEAGQRFVDEFLKS